VFWDKRVEKKNNFCPCVESELNSSFGNKCMKFHTWKQHDFPGLCWKNLECFSTTNHAMIKVVHVFVYLDVFYKEFLEWSHCHMECAFLLLIHCKIIFQANCFKFLTPPITYENAFLNFFNIKYCCSQKN
jgi:hypothetical protein